jgi:hypothetical protein
MRNVAAFGFLALTCGATAASAQGYGGGFIELLMTGRDPTPYVRPVRPFAGQAPDVYGRTRVAALPGAPLRDEVGVGASSTRNIAARPSAMTGRMRPARS